MGEALFGSAGKEGFLQKIGGGSNIMGALTLDGALSGQSNGLGDIAQLKAQEELLRNKMSASNKTLSNLQIPNMKIADLIGGRVNG
jgi:hypothetical protein